MAGKGVQRNPLVRSGLTQHGRQRAELAANHFQPDERDIADIILFGQRLAKHIQYYDADNARAGDWCAFFESDVSAALAALAKLPVDNFRTFQMDLEAWLKAEPSRKDDLLAAHAKLLFHLPIALLEIAGGHHQRLPADHPFQASITELAGRDLQAPLIRLIGWYKGAIDEQGASSEVFDDTGLVMDDYNLEGEPSDPRVRLSSTIADALIGRPPLSEATISDLVLSRFAEDGWADLYAATAPDLSPFADAVGMPHQRYEQIYDALGFKLFITSIEQVYQAIERIRMDAATYLTESLETLASHSPHYGLWLAFLQLFTHAQGTLNAFTGRHLDFYFKEVLDLAPRGAEPGKAHVLFELAKGKDPRRLTAGTLFRAGKDALGKPVAYALEDDIVVNQGWVVELRGLTIEPSGSRTASAEMPRAATVVPSRDGQGEVELAEGESWPPFGPLESPAARVGFAIADRKLFLREGVRTIIIRAALKAPLPTLAILPRWTVRLTGDEGWFEITDPALIETTLDNDFSESLKAATGERLAATKGTEIKAPAPSSKDEQQVFPGQVERHPIIEITVTLDANHPQVVPLDPKLHGDGHAAGIPVIELAFDFEADSTARAFSILKDVKADQLTLQTEAFGLKNLMVINGDSITDISKPFAAFGARPRIGTPLVIGSSEIFSKAIADWSLEVDWETPYSDADFFWKRPADDYDPVEEVLSNGSWREAAGAFVGNSAEQPVGKARTAPSSNEPTSIHLGEIGATIALNSASLIDGLAEQTLENPSLDAKSITGFMRVRLPRDFGHKDYLRENSRALVDIATLGSYKAPTDVNKAPNDQPLEPYEAMITRLEAAYQTLREPVEAFSHLHPFGAAVGTDDGRLFPELPFVGALLIGIAGFKPPARLTLLIQVADGSGDSLKLSPALDFALLDGDRWMTFEPQDVDDKTVNFARSGIIGLNLPDIADSTHRILPSGLHWIRIAASRDSGALNRLLSVDAQAARVVFSDQDNDSAFMAAPLNAQSIAKLKVPDPAIKTITQPYSGFDGRPLETADAFAVRVSERLRHKNRAVTMFDYEALVLEAFPNLFRVKCLSTTRLERNADGVIIADNELRPGAVTVVAVPWTHGQNARDPLRPYTDQATLAAVDSFLRQRLSPFITLEVQNPKLEEVQVDFNVRFTSEIGDIAFYIDELNQALIDFLTPWSQLDGSEITFGGRLWKSSIIDFIEEQPHVDFVTDVRLYHKVEIDAPPGGWSPVDVEMIETTTARSILVSAPRHRIAEVPGHD